MVPLAQQVEAPHALTAPPLASPQALAIFRRTIIRMVRADGPDLTQRQLALFLAVYDAPEPQTARALARLLNVSKPAVTRALDRLTQLDLLKRMADPADRRSILIGRTLAGAALVQTIRRFLAEAQAEG